MTSVGERLIEDGEKALERRLENAYELNPSGRALVGWAVRSEPHLEALQRLAGEISCTTDGGREYHDVAALGYAADLGEPGGYSRDKLASGLLWLCGRNPKVAGDPAPFFADSVALLGLAIGARALGQELQEKTREWLLRFVPEALQLPGLEPWNRCLLAAALHTSGHAGAAEATSPADVAMALRRRGSLDAYATREEEEQDAQFVLESLTQEVAADLPITRAALRLTSFHWVRRSAPVVVPGRVTQTQVIRLLESIPAGLRRWTWEAKAKVRGGTARQWHVEHEYHVQNLLCVVLGTLFPDMKDEEYLSSLGPKQPRTDLYLPSLSLLIEAKFVRPQDSFQRIIEEVAADAGLYLADLPHGTSLVPFVWDDSRRTEEHALLKRGLAKIAGVSGVVVISRPGSMQ